MTDAWGSLGDGHALWVRKLWVSGTGALRAAVGGPGVGGTAGYVAEWDGAQWQQIAPAATASFADAVELPVLGEWGLGEFADRWEEVDATDGNLGFGPGRNSAREPKDPGDPMTAFPQVRLLASKAGSGEPIQGAVVRS